MAREARQESLGIRGLKGHSGGGECGTSVWNERVERARKREREREVDIARVEYEPRCYTSTPRVIGIN